MSMSELAATIDAAFEARDSVNYQTTGEVRDAVNAALGLLDSGEARVAEKAPMGSGWSISGSRRPCC